MPGRRGGSGLPGVSATAKRLHHRPRQGRRYRADRGHEVYDAASFNETVYPAASQLEKSANPSSRIFVFVCEE